MKKIVFKAFLLIIAFTNVAMAWCDTDEIECHLKSSDLIDYTSGTKVCVYKVGHKYTISVTYKDSCPYSVCYNPETGKVRSND